MLFTFARILFFFFKYTKRAHPVFFLSQWTYFRFLSSLHMAQDLRPVLGRLQKGKVYIHNQIYNEVLLNHFNSEITRQTTHFWLPITMFLSVFKNLHLRNIT